MEQEITKSPLVQILETSGIEKTKGELVLEKFTAFFQQASEWEAKVKALVITDASQVREMKMAREGRLALRDIRVSAEKTKDKLKEASLIEGRFIMAVYNLIEGTIKPLENELLEKEKFAENMEKERLAKLQKERAERIAPYSNPAQHYLDGLSDSEFEDLFQNLKLGHEARIEQERKAEQERIEKEQAEAAERERIRLENEQLKKEAEEKEKAATAERLKIQLRNKEMVSYAFYIEDINEMLQLPDSEYQVKLGSIKAFAERDAELQRKKLDEENKIKAEQEANLKKEREAREKLEAEKLAAENKKKAEEKLRLDAEKKALKAPDKEKLSKLAVQIAELKIPVLASIEANDILRFVTDQLNEIWKYITKESQNL